MGAAPPGSRRPAAPAGDEPARAGHRAGSSVKTARATGGSRRPAALARDGRGWVDTFLVPLRGCAGRWVLGCCLSHTTKSVHRVFNPSRVSSDRCIHHHGVVAFVPDSMNHKALVAQVPPCAQVAVILTGPIIRPPRIPAPPNNNCLLANIAQLSTEQHDLDTPIVVSWSGDTRSRLIIKPMPRLERRPFGTSPD